MNDRQQPGYIDKTASELHAAMKSNVEFYVRQCLGDHVRPILRDMLLTDTLVHNELVIAIREEARELLAAFKTAAPSGPLISRAALREALESARFSDTEDERLDALAASLKKSGYFVL